MRKNVSPTLQLKTTPIYYFRVSLGQESGHSLTRSSSQGLIRLKSLRLLSEFSSSCLWDSWKLASSHLAARVVRGDGEGVSSLNPPVKGLPDWVSPTQDHFSVD